MLARMVGSVMLGAESWASGRVSGVFGWFVVFGLVFVCFGCGGRWFKHITKKWHWRRTRFPNRAPRPNFSPLTPGLTLGRSSLRDAETLQNVLVSRDLIGKSLYVAGGWVGLGRLDCPPWNRSGARPADSIKGLSGFKLPFGEFWQVCVKVDGICLVRMSQFVSVCIFWCLMDRCRPVSEYMPCACSQGISAVNPQSKKKMDGNKSH